MIKKLNIKIVILLILSLLLTACDISSQGGKEADEPIIVHSENENVLNFGIESVDTLNPIFTKSLSVSHALQLIFEPLFTFDETMNPIGVLAESCVTSEDKYRYTIKTKQGIMWHDGTSFSSRDVLHTINLIRYNDSPLTKSLSNISSVTTVDDNTIVIGLSRPVPNFTALLSFPIVKSSVVPDDIENYIPVGTGPYRYDTKVTNDKIKLVKFDSWHGETPTIGEIKLNVLKDRAAVADAFNASEIDAVASEVMDLKTNAPRGEIYTNDYITNNLVFVGMNNSSGSLSGANTRKAVSYLIDKQDIVTTEIFSRAAVADVPVNPSAWYYPQSHKADYDNEYIAEVLALDGWIRNDEGLFTRQKETYPEGSDIPVLVNEKLKLDIIVNDDNEERYRVANKIGDALNKFGIETEITLLSFADYTQRINDKNYLMFIGEIIMPDNMDQHFLLNDSNNYFSYYSDAMSDIVYRMATASTSEEQKNAYSEYMNVFNEEMPFVPLFFRKESVIFEKSLSGTSMPTVFNVFSNPQNWYLSQKN